MTPAPPAAAAAQPAKTETEAEADPGWADALAAAALLAVDPAGLGGALLRARCGPQRDQWLASLRQALPAGTPLRRLPLGIADERLLGGLDLAATLQAGRPVAQRGVLAEADGGLVLLAMAERLSAGTAARLAGVLDRGEVLLERDGLALRQPARIGVVALDEGVDDDEQAPAALADRLAFHLTLDTLPARAPDTAAVTPAEVAAARLRLPGVASGDASAAALCQTALALGVASLRAPWLALRAACAAAALQGRPTVEADDMALAARLVLGPRATRLPAPAEADPDDSDSSDDTDAAQDPPPAADPERAQDAPAPPGDQAPDPTAADQRQTPPDRSDPPDLPPEPDPAAQGTLDAVVLAAALSALPPGLLARLKAGAGPRGAPPAGGKSGAAQTSGLRGRPLASRRGELRSGTRLDLIATLRAAAPWQVLRRREADAAPAAGLPGPRRVLVKRDDFHIARRAQRRETTTVFVVDASGSAALHRLAEAKGAVELLLADCYVRRDRVALLVFRGTAAELVLPPTRSLVRAKRALAGLPGGGGTPLAHALDAAAALTAAIARRGGSALLVLLTDGRANIARDGQPGRERALADAVAAARRLRAAGIAALLVDTSPLSGRPAAAGPASAARQVADALAAQYLPLPQVEAAGLSRVVQGLARTL
jgi:magnesium chelatase subunit D